MSAKAISEQTGKEFLYKYICTSSAIQNRFKYARVTPATDWARLTQDHPWLLSEVRMGLALQRWHLCPPRAAPIVLQQILSSGSFRKDRSLLLLQHVHLQH